MDHDSNSRDSGDDFRSSAVISVAQRHACFGTLVDELVVRLYSFAQIPDRLATSSCIPERDSLALWSNIVTEADRWWIDHALDNLTEELRRDLVSEVLGRGQFDGALIAVGVYSRERLALLSHSDVQVMQSWVAALVTTHRALAQALALMVLAPWFADEADEQRRTDLVARVRGGTLGDVNSTLLVCLGLLHAAPDECSSVILDILACVASRSDLEAIDSLGGLIGRVWPLHPVPVEKWLNENCGRLPRRVFRLAVERLPAQKRTQLTQQWKQQRSINAEKKCPR